MKKIVGIDFGTTYCAVASVGESGRPDIVANRDGERTTPSVVLFQDDGSVLIGTAAKRASVLAPEDVVYFIKRQLGNRDWVFNTSKGVRYNAEEVVALILKRLKEDAEMYFDDITDAVITVPAYFDMDMRKAIQDAGKIAGLNVIRVLNEPTAAALAYGVDTKRDGTFLIFDLGGGTFDVTILNINNDKYDVIATEGLHKLGGKDWDDRLITWLNDRFQQEGGPDLTSRFEWEADLREKAEAAKRTLSQVDSTKVVLGAGDVTKTITVNRHEFENITLDLLNQARDLTAAIIDEAELNWGDIDDILLVGGSTRMPAVARLVEELSGRPPLRSGNPDELVALGAAVQAALETSKKDPTGSSLPSQLSKIVIEDVTSHGLGTVILVDEATDTHANAVIIPRNTKIPAQGGDIFYTVTDNQTALDVQVTQGDDTDLQYVKILGNQVLNIPPYPKNSPIRMEISYDLDQIAFISVYDLTANKLLGTFEVETQERLSDVEVQAATRKNLRTEVG